MIPTDERLAKLVGAILQATNRSGQSMGDAHVVAVCGGIDTAVVLTSDPNDIQELGEAIPGTRIISRRPEQIVRIDKP